MKARRLFAFVLLIIGSFAPMALHAGDGMKPSSAETKLAIHVAVSGQLAAFRAQDYAAAYVYADEEFKARMPIESFERMVKLGYPLIAHSIAAKCGLTFDNGDEATVNVQVLGAEETVTYQYLLRRDGDAWRIMGVAALRERTTEV